MSKVLFRTPGAIPLDAFTTFGVNAKPNSKSPFGFFGTGIKYAVSVILRNGGKIQVFVKGVEYEFYLHQKDFRGKEFRQVRMRKRKRGMLSWMKSEALPFTTELGKNWKLWEAFRELESNTRDENGETLLITRDELADGEEFQPDVSGTDILIDCPGFFECVGATERPYGGREVVSRVFLDIGEMEEVLDTRQFTMYEGASEHIYYQGIRVYDLRNPSRFTYNFKPGFVELSEDRSAKNIWNMQWAIANRIQEIEDHQLLLRLLEDDKHLWFETDEISFNFSGSEHFQYVAKLLREKAPSRSLRGYYGMYPHIEQDDDVSSTDITLHDDQWEFILELLEKDGSIRADEISEKIRSEF